MLSEFYQRYFLPPVGVTPQNRCFSIEHILISAILFLMIAVVFSEVARRKSQSFSKKTLLVCAWAMLLLEIFRIGWNWAFHGLSLTMFRFDFCNQICMFLPFCVIFGNKKIYPYIQVLAIAGGLAVLIYPLWVFYDYAGFHIMALQSMVSHALMFLCGLIMPYASGRISGYREVTRKSVVGVLLIMLVAFIMSNVTGQNYLLMKGANGLPIVELIPYPWYFFVVLPICVFIIRHVSMIHQHFICLSARIPADSKDLYNTPTLSPEDYAAALNEAKLKLMKIFRPFKYRKTIAQIGGEMRND